MKTVTQEIVKALTSDFDWTRKQELEYRIERAQKMIEENRSMGYDTDYLEEMIERTQALLLATA
jgi:hypothetical protein